MKSISPWTFFFDPSAIVQKYGLVEIGALEPVDRDEYDARPDFRASFNIMEKMRCLMYTDTQHNEVVLLGLTRENMLWPMQRFERNFRKNPTQNESVFEPVTGIMFQVVLSPFTTFYNDLPEPVTARDSGYINW